MWNQSSSDHRDVYLVSTGATWRASGTQVASFEFRQGMGSSASMKVLWRSPTDILLESRGALEACLHRRVVRVGDVNVSISMAVTP